VLDQVSAYILYKEVWDGETSEKEEMAQKLLIKKKS